VVNNVNITNVYNTVYVNKTVYNQTFVNVRAPNAVVAMPHAAFASGRPVRESGVVVSNAQLSRFQPGAATMVAPPVAPTRQALATTVGGGPVARPPVQVAQRQVVARNTPPAAVAPFAARQAYLQQHAGQLHELQAMHQAAAPPNVRLASPARPVPTQPGQRGGNVAENTHFSRPTPAQPHTLAAPQTPSRPQALLPAAQAVHPPHQTQVERTQVERTQMQRSQMERTQVQAPQPRPQPPSKPQTLPLAPAVHSAERTQVQTQQPHPQRPPQENPHFAERSQSQPQKPPPPAAEKPHADEHHALPPPPKREEHKDEKDRKDH
jgi:hypothetical protein